MAAVSGAIPNLIGGVSQQPPEIRALNCSTALVNTWSDVVSGLATRPFGEYVGKIGTAPLTGSSVATHLINSAKGTFLLSIYDGTIKIVRLVNGGAIAQTVTVEGDAGNYLTGTPKAQENFGFVTVGDTTFIYNRMVTVTKTLGAESGPTGRTEGGIVRLNPNLMSTYWVKQRAGYEAYYSIYYNGVLKGSVVTDSQSPSAIAGNLKTDLVANSIVTTMVTSTVYNITLATEGDYITARDDFADQAVFAFNDAVDEFTDLPNMDAQGRLVRIRGDIEEDADDYWVWQTGATWEETYGWNSYEKPNNATMPVILVYNGGTSWTLKQTDWPGREVGDADSNPTPSFVGRTIRDMFIYKGRMCLLADENFLASRVGNFESFYRSTCTQLLDDDPIDIASPDSSGAPVNFAMEFNKGLLIFSAADQFRVAPDSEGILSPNSVSIDKVNHYGNTPDARPCYIGANITFVNDYGTKGFASLSEYQVERVFGTEVALPITDAVPEYIPGGVYQLLNSSTNNNITLLTGGDRTSLWLYNYYFNGEGKVQSAWQKWAYTGKLFGAVYNREKLVVVILYGNDLYALQHTFDAGADTVLDSRSIMLDYRCSQTSAPAVTEGTGSRVTLPYTVPVADRGKVVLVIDPLNGGPLEKAQSYRPASFSGNTAFFPNVDLTGNTYCIGLTYQFRWKPSPIYVRDRNLVAIQDGRLQLRRMSLLFNQSGPFRTHFTPTARDTYVSEFSGFTLGTSDDQLGSFSLNSGEFRVAVNGAGEALDLEIEAWTPWRVRFSTLEWDGSYRPKKKRM